MEEKPFIKTEPQCLSYSDEFHNIVSNEQLPSNKLQDEAGVALEDIRIVIKQEREIQESFEQLPSDSLPQVKAEEPDDVFEDAKVKDESSTVQEEPEEKGAYLKQEIQGDKDITIVERVTTDIVPCVKTESSSSAKNRDLREDIKEDTQDKKGGSRGAHSNEYVCNRISNSTNQKLLAINMKRPKRCNSGYRAPSETYGKDFAEVDNLVGRNAYSCQICKRNFNFKWNLKAHLIIHSGMKLHACNESEMKFYTARYLRRYLLVHSSYKEYACDICAKAFARKSTLKVHLFVHNGVKPYTCQVCGKKFARSSEIKNHMRIHSSKRDYMCSACHKAFKSKDSLKSHITHCRKKVWHCATCGKEFTTSARLKNHSLLHSGQAIYVCDLCERIFLVKSSLKTHVSHHMKPLACETSKKHFSTNVI